MHDLSDRRSNEKMVVQAQGYNARVNLCSMKDMEAYRFFVYCLRRCLGSGPRKKRRPRIANTIRDDKEEGAADLQRGQVEWLGNVIVE